MKNKKVALITGQDGPYLAVFKEDPHSIGKNLTLHYGDLTDSSNLTYTV